MEGSLFMCRWNTAPVVALDVTNPEAVAWFLYRLRKLQAETGIDGFKFDAGEALLHSHQTLKGSSQGRY